MDEREIIAKNITFYRKSLGLSQLELAEKLQYSNKNISKWEKGETTPSIFTLKRLAEIFGITVDQLVSGGEQQPIKQEQKKGSSLTSKVLWLLLSNAILLVCACVAIYVLGMLQVSKFNKWLILVYILPLSALSVFIFIACVKKRVDVISISVSGWFLALCIYLTFPKVSGIGYIFFLMFGLQVLTLIIMLIINYHIIFRRRKTKKQHDNRLITTF